MAAERSAGALAPDSRVVDVGALYANVSAGSATSRATANPDTNGGRLMTELGKVVWLGGGKLAEGPGSALASRYRAIHGLESRGFVRKDESVSERRNAITSDFSPVLKANPPTIPLLNGLALPVPALGPLAIVRPPAA